MLEAPTDLVVVKSVECRVPEAVRDHHRKVSVGGNVFESTLSVMNLKVESDEK